MRVLHIRLVMVPDMCHRLPNDAKLAMQESGMWIFVLLLIPIYNLFWGPWNSCRWAQEAAWALKELGAFEFSVARWVFEYESSPFPQVGLHAEKSRQIGCLSHAIKRICLREVVIH